MSHANRSPGRLLGTPRIGTDRARRSLTTVFVACLAAIGVALALTGGSYALFNSSAPVNGATITAGTTSITVNGSQSATLPGSISSALAPGRSTATALTVANTGTTAASVAVSSTTVGAQTNSLGSYLTATLTPVSGSSACTVGLVGTTGALTGFTSTIAPVTIASGASATLCLELKLSASAPSSAQGGSAPFTVTLTGSQVAP